MTTRCYRSKIGRLPFAIRNELNERIRDGETGPDILSWINGLKETRRILREFNVSNGRGRTPAAPPAVSAQNLTDWRSTGYSDWLNDQERADRIRRLAEISSTISASAGGNAAGVGCNIATAKIMDILEETDPEKVADLAKALVQLRSSENAAQKVALAKEKNALAEEQLSLSRAKFERDRPASSSSGPRTRTRSRSPPTASSEATRRQSASAASCSATSGRELAMRSDAVPSCAAAFSPPSADAVIKMRSGQRRLFQLVEQYRLLGFIARRQYGKTTTCANIALMKMMKHRDHTVIFGSAKLNLSREIVRKEAAVFEKAINAAMARIEDGKVQLADDKTGRNVHGLTHDDFADLFEHSRLEFRYYHSRTSYSRTKVVALRPDTVGETGDLMCDEVGRIGNWKDVWEAVEPIVASNPQFRILLLTTPPPDDAHYSFEQLAPPPGMTFDVSPSGNVYESVKGVTCLRVDAWDAYADGVTLYDTKTAKPVTPEESRRRAFDKDAWDRNYGCLFITGGTAAVGLVKLMEAMSRGERAGCVFALDDLPPGWERLFDLNKGPIGIGADPATTEGETSNPFGVAVTQLVDGRYVTKLIISFKSADPKKPKAILRELCNVLHPRALAIDATSEVYWATEVREELESVCNVILVKNSEKTDVMGERVLYKTYLGQLLVNAIEEDRVDLPNAPEVKDDFRLVKKFKGGFDNALDSATGRHGDLFDGTKLSHHALIEGTEPVRADAVQLGSRASVGGDHRAPRRLTMTPYNASDDTPETKLNS